MATTVWPNSSGWSAQTQTRNTKAKNIKAKYIATICAALSLSLSRALAVTQEQYVRKWARIRCGSIWSNCAISHFFCAARQFPQFFYFYFACQTANVYGLLAPLSNIFRGAVCMCVVYPVERCGRRWPLTPHFRSHLFWVCSRDRKSSIRYDFQRFVWQF